MTQRIRNVGGTDLGVLKKRTPHIGEGPCTRKKKGSFKNDERGGSDPRTTAWCSEVQRGGGRRKQEGLCIAEQLNLFQCFERSLHTHTHTSLLGQCGFFPIPSLVTNALSALACWCGHVNNITPGALSHWPKRIKPAERKKKCRGHIMTSYHVRFLLLSILFPIASQGLALWRACMVPPKFCVIRSKTPRDSCSIRPVLKRSPSLLLWYVFCTGEVRVVHAFIISFFPIGPAQQILPSPRPVGGLLRA